MPKAVDGIKVCGKCRVSKPVSEYHKSRVGSDGLHNQCKECGNAAKRDWRKRHPDRNRAGKAVWEKQNPAYSLAKKGVKVTNEWYYDRYALLEGKCEICGQFVERLHIDHDHETNEVRGLLCRTCNVGLGHFGDSKEMLIKATRYLTR